MSDFFQESWSLSVEEWFYTLVPILILTYNLVKKRISFKNFLLFIIFFVIICVTMYRAYTYFNLPVKNYNIYDKYFLRQVLSRIDAIMFGVFGAWLHYYHREFFYKNRWIHFFLGILILLLTHTFEWVKDPIAFILAFTFTSIGVLLMLPLMRSWEDTKSILKMPVIYCSLISYSLYLVNMSLIAGMLNRFENIPNFCKWILFWILNLLISLILYKYFEYPIMRLRDRLTNK